MIDPKSYHDDEKEGGFGVVKDANYDYIVQSPNQSLQLVPHPIGFHSSASTNANPIQIQISSGMSRKGSSNVPKAFKKKNGYHQHQGIKKPRLIWTDELHQYFLEIYNRSISPNEKLFPKKILEKMREKFPFITRENIASHLQKHRLSLKKGKNKENSGKRPSPKSGAPKVVKESNSTNPNSQLILQSHSNSTNPSSSHLPLQKKPHIKDGILLNHEFHFHFDQTNHVSNQTVMKQPSFNNNVVHGGTNFYSNGINNLESQENPNWTQPIAAETNDPSAFSINVYPPPISTNQFSKMDGYHYSYGYGNGNGIGSDPTTDYNSYGGLNHYNNEYYFPDNLLGFEDYNMNLNSDNVQANHLDGFNNDRLLLGRSEVLDFGYPCNYNVINDFRMDIEQGLQSILCPSLNHMKKGDATSQQCFGCYNHHLLPPIDQHYLLPQTIENQSVEQQSNLTRMNENFPSKDCMHNLKRRNGNGTNRNLLLG